MPVIQLETRQIRGGLACRIGRTPFQRRMPKLPDGSRHQAPYGWTERQPMPQHSAYIGILLAAIALITPPAIAGPLKVYILAGQSNMEGQAVVDLTGRDYNEGRGTLVSLLADPEKGPTFRHLRDAAGKWEVRDDVWVRYQREKQPLLAGPLGPGFSVYGDKHHFGPEWQFGRVIGQAEDDQVLLIKTAWGGKSLGVEFRPPGSGGAVGPSYALMISQIREALGNLKADFPSYDGKGYELAGFIWWHGWNDFCDARLVSEYEPNLVNLIHDVRKDLNAPKLPFVIGELAGPWAANDKSIPKTAVDVREAQKAVAARTEFKGSVAFVETRDFVRKPEDSPNPGHGHHEFGNAETYFLVGDALAQAMLKLRNNH